MKLSHILKFAWRYFRAKKSTNAINIISWVSMLAMLFGTASLLIVLSAFNGFESLVQSLYGAFYPDIKVSAVRGKTIQLTQEQLNEIRSLSGIASVSLVAEEKALVQNGDMQTIVTIKGVDSSFAEVNDVSAYVYRGAYELGTDERPGLVMGIGIEQALGLLSDRTIYPVSVYLPKKGAVDLTDPVSSLSVGTAQPTGSFAIQSEFDNKYVLTNLDFLRAYAGYGATDYSGLEIKLKQDADPNSVQLLLQQQLGEKYNVEDRFQQNRTLYATMKMEKVAVYAILTLILAVAAFNMVGALSMLVMEKRRDIQVLKAMGATNSMIQRIFLSEGLLLSLLGAGGGIAISILLYYIQVTYKIVPLQGATFLIDYYPIQLRWEDFTLVTGIVIAIAVIASWAPSRKAASSAVELRN
ncbi:MAG: FtsX-like permease family protein [Chitinophagaceae bacterium]|jgi:lipoprotein-releasing system permease protein